MSTDIKIDFEKGTTQKADLEAAKAALLVSIEAIDKEDFDGAALEVAKKHVDELARLLADYVIPIVAVSNGITVNRLRRGDIIQTLDKGANSNGGRITGFIQDNSVVEYTKGNGQKGSAHVTYVRHV